MACARRCLLGVCPGAVPSVKIHGEEDEPGVSNANAKMKVNLHCPIYFSSPSPSPSPESSPCQSPVLSKRKKLETKKPEIQPKTEMIKIEVESINQQENIIMNMKKDVQMMIEDCPSASPDLSQSDIKPVKPSEQLKPTRFSSENPDLLQPDLYQVKPVDEVKPFKQTQATSLELPCTGPDLSGPEVNLVKPMDTVKSFKRTKPTTLEDYKELLKKSRLLATTYRLRCKTYRNKILRMKKKIEAKRQEKL